MKKHFAWAVLSAAALLALGSCGETPATSSSSQASSTPVSSQVQSSAQQTSEQQSSQGQQSSSKQEAMEHFPAPVTTIAEGAKTRDYDERFDAMLDDMSAAVLNGQGEISSPVLRSVVDSNLGVGFACSPDAAIYKMATGSVKFETQAAIGFKIRVVKGSLKLSDLVLALRGGDDIATYPVEVGTSVNVDGDANPELSGEWQNIDISLDEAKDAYYPNADGTTSTMKVGDGCLGFHLYAHSDHEVGAVIEIAEVYALDASGTKTTLDSFSRDNIGDASKTEAAAWWCGTTAGGIVRKGVQLGGNSQYKTPYLDSKYGDIVITAAGDFTGMTINDVPFSSWKDIDGNPVVNAVDGAYASYAIDLAQSGITGSELTMTSTTDVRIANVFSTNFEEPNLNLVYPRLNKGQAAVIDNFDRTQSSFGSDWDNSVDPSDEKTSHLNGIVSYAMGDQIHLDGQDLCMPATEAYAELTIGSKNAYKGAQYVVFDIRSSADLDLNNFRFSFGAGSAIYLNSTYASEGVPTIENKQIVENPYVHGDYTWFIVDLSLIKDFSDDTLGAMNLYYTGPSDLYINAIYFMEQDIPFTSTGAQEFADTDADHNDLDLSGYHYIAGLDMTATDSLVRYEVKGDGEATFDSFRVEYNGKTLWVKDGGVVAYVDGRKVGLGTLIPTDWSTVVFDLEASGYDVGTAGPAHLHTGGGFTGKISVRKAEKGRKIYSEKLVEDIGPVSYAANTYNYLGYVYVAHPDADMVLAITFKGDGKIATLANFRIEQVGGAARWISHSDAAEHIDAVYADGTAVDCNAIIPAEGVTVYFHMDVFGGAAGGYHLHYSGNEGGDSTLAACDITGIYEYTPYQVILGE